MLRLINGAFLCLMMTAVCGATSAADRFVIEFSGVFDECDADCVTAGFAHLAGTAFHGAVAFPTSGEAAMNVETSDSWMPYDGLQTIYEYSPGQASFELSTIDPAIELSSSAVPIVNVHDCIDSTCPYKADLVLISAISGDLRFDLTLGGWGQPRLSSNDIPSLETLEILSVFATFSVATSDFSAFLNSVNPEAMPLDITVTEEISVVSVPLPPGFLFFPFVTACFWFSYVTKPKGKEPLFHAE